MRLLFDEQLSEELCTALADLYPESLHVRLLDRSGASDTEVWELARQHKCVLVSKDEDFHRLSVLRGAPPKFVWIRIGNCPTEDIVDLLRLRRDDVVRFCEQGDLTVLELA